MRLLFLTLLVFLVLVIFFLPKILYLSALVYHVLFKKEEPRKKSSYSLKDLKEVKSERVT